MTTENIFQSIKKWSIFIHSYVYKLRTCEAKVLTSLNQETCFSVSENDIQL